MTLFGAEQTQATSDDYYTPAWIFETLGLRFNLDVCAPPPGCAVGAVRSVLHDG